MTQERPAFETDPDFYVPENQNNYVPVETANEVIVLQGGQMMLAFPDIIGQNHTNDLPLEAAHRPEPLELNDEECRILALTYSAAAGNIESFWTLFSHYAPLMQGSVGGVLGGEYEAIRDVIHSVGQQMASLVDRNQFLNQNGRPITHTSFRNYLSWAVRTQAIKYMKKSNTEQSVDATDAERWQHAMGSHASPVNVEDMVMSRIILSDAMPLLREVFNKLTPLRREILIKRYWEGLTDEQIGIELGMTGHHVNVDLRRTLHQLRRSKELVNALRWLYGRGDTD